MSFGAGPNGLLWRDGDEVVDLSGLGDVFARPTLNELLAAGRPAWEDAIAAARSHDGPRVAAPDMCGRGPQPPVVSARAAQAARTERAESGAEGGAGEAGKWARHTAHLGVTT